jgi:PmbA protein
MIDAEKTLDAARKAGATHAELYVIGSTSFSVRTRDLEIEAMSLDEDAGAGLRVIDGEHRLGFAYSTRPDDTETLVAAAMAGARITEPDEHNVLTDEDDVKPWREDLVEERFDRIDAGRKIEKALVMERVARAAEPRISGVHASSYADGTFEVSIFNTSGLNRSYRGAACSASLTVVASDDGGPEVGGDFDHARTFDALDEQSVARSAAERAASLLGAAPVPSRSTPVVLDRYVAADILGVIVESLRADFVIKGKSMLAGAVGEAVANSVLHVVDCADVPGAQYPRPIDDEGAMTTRTTVIENGILKGYLHNAYTAHRMGVARGGHASRSSFRGTPEVGVSNLYIEPGTSSLDDLFAGCGEGFYVTEVLGIHTADPISGDFSVGAAGRWIESGELAAPVRGVTIAGNIKDVLLGVDVVANDLKFSGRLGSPSLLVRELAVGGV